MTKITTFENFDRARTVKIKIASTDPLIKLKKYSGCVTGIGPGLDKNGFPVTGLTEDYQPARVDGKVQKKIPGTRVILERELDLEEGTLKQNSVYWHGFTVPMDAEDLVLDLRDGHDLLKYLFCVAQSNVADGLKNIQQSSQIEFVIYSTIEEAQQRNRGRKNLKDAYNLADKLDVETKVNIMSVYGEVVDATAPSIVEDKIDEKIEQDPAKFLKIANDGNLIMKSLVSKALDKAVFIMRDGGVFHGEVSVGYDKASAAIALGENPQLEAIVRAKLNGDLELIQKALNYAKVKETVKP